MPSGLSLVRRYCGKMGSRHLFSYGGLPRNIVKVAVKPRAAGEGSAGN